MNCLLYSIPERISLNDHPLLFCKNRVQQTFCILEIVEAAVGERKAVGQLDTSGNAN